MSIAFYKTVHFVCIAALALYTAGLALMKSHGAGGGLRKALSGWPGLRPLLAAVHGSALLLLFVSGFGLIAKLNIPFPWPAWLFVKLFVWLALGAAPFFLKSGAGPLIPPRIPGLSKSRLKIPRERAAMGIMLALLLAAVFSALWKY